MPRFDRIAAENLAETFLRILWNGDLSCLPSGIDGVIAVPALPDGGDRLDYWALAAHLANETGYDIACAARCGWTLDDGSTAEAVFIAFDVAELDAQYRTDRHSLVSPFSASDAPTPDEVDDCRRAVALIESRLDQLSCLSRSLSTDESQIHEMAQLTKLMMRINPIDHEAVSAILDGGLSAGHGMMGESRVPFRRAQRPVPHMHQA